MKNKRGVMGIIWFFLILLVIVMIGIIGAVVVGAIKFGSNTLEPIMTDIGVVGDWNVSQAGEFTFGTMNSMANSLPWIMGFGYIVMLIMSFVFAISYNYNPNPAFLGFYVILVIFLILGCFLMSNLYEDLYSGTDEIALELQNQTVTSFMILYSPIIMAAIALITGLYIFTIKQQEYGVGI